MIYEYIILQIVRVNILLYTEHIRPIIKLYLTSSSYVVIFQAQHILGILSDVIAYNIWPHLQHKCKINFQFSHLSLYWC